MNESQKTLNISTILKIFFPFALAYLLSYFYRVVNAVIANDLSAAFSLDADQLGLLTGAYFLAFAGAQLPLGVLLDRFGSRRTESALLVVAAIGAVRFATSDSVADLLIGRALIGLGVSACLMAAFRAYVIWFPPGRLPLINGCQMAAGGLGAILATAPARAAVDTLSWHGVFFALSAVTLLSAVLVYVVVPREPCAVTPQTWSALGRGIHGVYASAAFWRVAPLTIASQASFFAIQGLWAGPWLTNVAGLSADASARCLFFVALTMIAGFLILGALAERLGRRRVPTTSVGVAGMSVFMLTQLIIVTRIADDSYVPWLLFGFFGTAGILPYAALSQCFPPHLAGRVNTCLNVLVFVSAFAAQWGIGAIISHHWAGSEAAASVAPTGAYQSGFALLLVVQAAGLLWFFVFRRGRLAAA